MAIGIGAVLLVLVAGGVGWLTSDALAPWRRQQTGEEHLAQQVRGLWHLLSGRLRPNPATAPEMPVQHASIFPYGVNTFLQTEVEPDKVARSLEMIGEAGFGWIRQEFPWEDLEIHHKGWFVDLRDNEIKNGWTKYDRIVALAEQHQVEIIARLSNPPAWSRAVGDDVGSFAPPDKLQDYCDYVKAVVGRYRDRVRYFQIWNEPNIFPEWGTYAISPEGYTELLKVGATCAREANPEVVIITAPLAPTIELTQRDLNDFIFLQRMYAAGAAPYFDILAVQDYGLWSGPYDRRMRPRVLNFSRPLYIRDLMLRNGDGHKAIWASEVGWNSAPPEVGTPFGRASETERANYAVEAFGRVRREWPWMGVVTYWFWKQSDARERDQAQYYFRLVEPDFSPTPAYTALAEHMRAVRANPTLFQGSHQEDHWTLRYGEGWTERRDTDAIFGRYREGQAGATLELGVEGGELWLMVRPGTGQIEVSLDGAAPSTLSLPTGSPPTGEALPLRIAAGLAPGRHTLTVRVASGVLGLDGVLVR